jgi:MFS family permease
MVGVTALAFAIGVSINVLEPAVLSHKILRFAPEWKNTALGLATFTGLVVAALVQPIVGARSDRTRSRWGRRVPYLVIGGLLVMLAHFGIVLAPSLSLVIVGLLGLQLASNTLQGPWQALIPDRVPYHQRGFASGLKASFEVIGFVVGRYAGGELVADGNLVGAASVASGALALALLITLLLTPSISNQDQPGAARRTLPWWMAFRVRWRQRPAFALWFLNRFLFWGAVITINTFVLFYLMDVHRLPEPGAQRIVGQLGVVLGLAVLLVALPAGWVADRVGRRPIVVLACLLAAGGVIVLLGLRTPTGVTLAGAMLGIATGVFLSGSWALVTDLVPSAQAARYLGVANVASAGGSALARAGGGLLIDPINQWAGSPSAGYTVVFGLACLALLVSAGVMLRLRLPTESA